MVLSVPAVLAAVLQRMQPCERASTHPCCAHSQALGAEIIVTFEGTSENGAQFMSRQSYLSSEIHWGYIFVDIVHHAKPGETNHTVDIARQVNLRPTLHAFIRQVYIVGRCYVCRLLRV